ncbi:hypothetical protein [Microseira sp. BLCC-F43]|jgi:hypothetical protein|uniref:hypothetical protein n=1 Tax=Microseira sp. BLCC-F43 TaxID=3153602 RepID=UPI0035BAFD79
MKDKNLHIRLSAKRLDKLRQYAESREKTITQLVEDWIDTLPNASVANQHPIEDR